jgi:hypothetical protein
MDQAVVFLGPSLDLAEARRIAPGFSFRPPAAQGDIYRAVSESAPAIGLVDGYFEGVPAVWHKEILFALTRGVHVFGAGSMGALRAAELDTFGMRGIGRIYAWYAEGALDADDEVAVAHAPAELGYSPLTEPLVNVRASLERAMGTGVLSPDLAESILGSARALFYKQRTWPAILARVDAPPAALADFSAWLEINKIDQKRLDALALLEAMAELVDNWPGPFQADFAFEPTYAWNVALADFHSAAVRSDLDSLVLDEARLAPDAFRDLLHAAALTLLGRETGALTMEPRRGGRRLDSFRMEQGLADREKFARWLQANALGERELDTVLQERERIAGLIAASLDRVLDALLTEIKLRGLYGSLAERARAKEDALSGQRTGEVSTPTTLLLEWFYETRLGKPPSDDIDETCRRLALPSHFALRDLLAREFLFATLKR